MIFCRIRDFVSSLCVCVQDPENLSSLSLDKVNLQFHTYRLEEEEIQSEQLSVSNDGDNETISAANYCLLPHVTFNGIWENLVYDSNIKENVSNCTLMVV